MKNLHVILFALITFFSHSYSTAQVDTIAKGRFFTSDGKIVVFKNLSMNDNTYRFNGSTGSQFQEISSDQILKIEKQTGTEAGSYALWVGLSGLVGSSLGVLQSKAQYPGVEFNGAPIIFGLTAVSALIGAAIGAGQKKYSEVILNPSSVSQFIESRMKIDLALGNRRGSICMTYTF